MTNIIFHIGHDTVRPIVDLIAYLNEIRAESALLKLLLWPLVYALTFIKVMTNYLVFGAHKFYYYSMPYNILTTRNHFFSATPMSVACFNKRGFALVLVEMIFFFYMMCIPGERPWLILPYLFFKIMLTAVPFIALTPVQRLPFWFLAVIFTAIETWAGLVIIRTWGYGINFEHDHFYNHWGKHYRYRSITSNRVIGTELSQMIYVLAKVLVLNDYFCYNEDVLNARILAPNKPTLGILLGDVTENAAIGPLLLLALIVFCFCWPRYSAFFSRPNKTMQTTFMTSNSTLSLLTTLMIFFGLPSTLLPYCLPLSFLLNSALLLLVVFFLTSVLDTRSEASLSAAPIPERLPTANTAVAVIYKSKLFLSTNAATCCNMGLLFFIKVDPNATASQPNSSWTAYGLIAVVTGACLLVRYFLQLKNIPIQTTAYKSRTLSGDIPAANLELVKQGEKASCVYDPSNPPVDLPQAMDTARTKLGMAVTLQEYGIQEAVNAEGTQLILESKVDAAAKSVAIAKEQLATLKAQGGDVRDVETAVKHLNTVVEAPGEHKNNLLTMTRSTMAQENIIVTVSECREVFTPERFARPLDAPTTAQGWQWGHFWNNNKLMSGVWYRPVNARWEYQSVSPGVRRRTNGSLGDDYDFVNALIEQDSVASLRYGVLFLLALSSLGVYSIILAGWSSNSKYAFIGALRSAAQMISYEVAISLIILPVVVFCGSLDLSMITFVQYITDWLCWPLLPITLLFLIAMLAETNRTPFDLPEAEAELVAGYNVDYSSLPFAMFFLGEYCNMILISTLFCLLFLAGGLNTLRIASSIMLSAKAAVSWIFFVLVRATLPRYRYDQLMDIGWKVFLPTSGSFLPFVFGILVIFRALPVSNELPRNPWVI